MLFIKTSMEEHFLKILSQIKKIISSSCIFFTFIIITIYTLGVSINSSWIPTIEMLYSVLAFSLILSVSNIFLFSDKLIFALRLLLHCIFTSIMFYIFFIKLSGYKSNGGSPLTIMLVYLFVYALFGIIIAVYRYLISDSKTNKSDYNKIF